MNQVLIHCKSGYFSQLKELGLKPFEMENDMITVQVNDVDYTVENGYYPDPDEQLCEHYGIDYDQVYSLEAAESC